MDGFGSMLKDYLDYNKISQTDFADRLGISQKHMNEIINGKTNLSIDLILGISLLTDIDANLIYYVENKKRLNDELILKYKNTKSINNLLNSFYIKEMVKKGWIKLKDSSSYIQNYMDLLEYLNVKDISKIDEYLEKRYLFKRKNESDNKKIFLWIKHCDNMIKNISAPKYDSSKFNELLNELKIESNKKFNKDDIINILLKYGIILCVEDALTGSKVRGVSKVMIDTPVIYMTSYYKEKSSFYFTLYHELMHIKKEYNILKKKTVVDDEDNESEMDKLALNEMIDDNIYKEILKDISKSKEISKKYNIPLGFIYSRLAYDKKISYTSKVYLSSREKI